MSIYTEIIRIQEAKNAMISALGDKGVDVSTGASISDFGTYIENVEPNLQEKTLTIDIDSIDSSVEFDSSFDGLSAVAIDSSALNVQRTNILNHLLGIAGTSIVDVYISESDAQILLNRLLGIAGTSVVNAVIDDNEAQTIVNELNEI